MNKRFRRRIQRLGLVVLGLLTASLVLFKPAPQAATEPWIPTVPVQWDKHYARVPDCRRVSVQGETKGYLVQCINKHSIEKR